MRPFRQSHSREISNSVDRIVAGLEAANFDKATTLVLGGSALALAGIRPTNDLDLMTTGENFHVMERTHRTPSGLQVIRKPDAVHAPFLQFYPRNNRESFIIPIDITFPHDDNFQPHPMLDQQLIEHIATFDSVAGYSYIPPERVAEHKAHLPRLRHKDRRDIKSINR